MHLQRTLWVEDQYALRCRGCNVCFSMLWRRHHCRHCGQVFCKNCLISSPTSPVSGIVTDMIFSFVSFRREPMVKVCHECDRILRQRGLVGDGSRRRFFRSTKLRSQFATMGDGTGTIAEKGNRWNETTEKLGRNSESMVLPLLQLPEELSLSLSSTKSSPIHKPQRERLPTHPENVMELEISYGLTDTPSYSRNSLEDWLLQLLKESHKLQTNDFPSRSELFSVAPTYTPYPKATFSRAAALREHLQFANIFSTTVPKESLWRLERQISLHLIKRASRLFMAEVVLSSSSSSFSEGEAKMDRVEWIAGICDISWRVVSQTVFSLNQQVTQHFDVICISGGVFADTKIITGVAFVQTIAFKRMKTYVESPSILLLKGDVGTTMNMKMNLLEYVEGYEGYLDKQYQRICIWQPSVIVVEGNMHHYLQKRILSQSNSILILRVGKTVINRLSRCCNATVICDLQYVSMADLYDTSKLGTCDSFELVPHGDKSICVFNCLRVPLFTTVILRGAQETQLAVAKRIVFICVTTAYHLSIQAHCIFDLGMLYTEPHSSYVDDTIFNKLDNEDGEKEDDGLPPWGEASLGNCGRCEEYMQLIACSPRVEDRIETLSMNAAVVFPNELVNMDDKYDDLMTDSIIVNTVFLECVLGGLTGEDASGGTPVGPSPNYTVHQSREVFPFYSEGDETLLDYLTGRAREGDSMRLIVHCNKRIWVKTTTDLNSLSMQNISVDPENLIHSQELALFSLTSHSSGKVKDDTNFLLPRCYAICKNCFNSAGGSPAKSLALACSLHTLNLSWGAFLEFMFYGASQIVLSCGHSLNPDVCISFFLGSRAGTTVIVSIMVEPLIVYDIITPPLTMPPCGNVAQLHLKDEIEELQRYVMSVIATIVSLTDLQAQQQAAPQPQLQSGGSAQFKAQKIPFSSLNNVRGFGSVEMTGMVEEEKGRELLRSAENLLAKLTALDTMEAVTLLRLEGIANLMTDFMEWYKAGTAMLERRTGKNSFILDATVFEDNNWAFSPEGNCGVRLNEPTCLVAAALQAISFSPGCQMECPSEHLHSKPRHLSGLTPNSGVHNDESEPNVEEQLNGFHEDSIEFMLGIEPSLSPDAQSSSLFIRSESDALDILCRKSTVDKTTFKYVMNALIPWDKTEDITVRVEVMFPEQFAALQYLYTRGQIADMLLSLSRCRAFKSEGGKTKSDFFVTVDERFLMKQIKQTELKHFAEFAPNYFNHLSQMYSKSKTFVRNDGPHLCGSVLAKVFGVFSVHIKRRKRVWEIPGEIRYFVLMENIFFSRRVDIIYDLKGSQRNRTAVEGSTVLLDQDLITTLRKGAFFYCTNEVKSYLIDSITCDAHLLSASSIMDYSLIAGLNRSSCQLYLGIVDYLHPYTGVKVIESKVKAGLDTVLGLAGRDPTIIDPVSYRVRFARWMEGCFCGVPEKAFTVGRVLARKKRQSNS